MAKSLLSMVLIACTFTLLIPNSQADEKREAKPRFKGVELYSWKNNEGEWVFALLSGTNRQKNEKEVKDEKNLIKGTKELKKALALLAEGENVIWSSHRLNGFEFPPEKVRKEIEKTAKESKIDLAILAE